MFVQTGSGKTGGNQFSVCLYVDGVIGHNCQEVGSTPSDGTYAVSSTSQLVAGIAAGNHVVQTYFTTNDGASVFNHTSNYRVYKP